MSYLIRALAPPSLAASGPTAPAAPHWQRLVVLAPALLVGGGLVAGVFIVLGRGLLQTIRESGHRRAVYVALLLLAAACVLLTYLGIQLPRE